jgi:hypothetical protein
MERKHLENTQGEFLGGVSGLAKRRVRMVWSEGR